MSHIGTTHLTTEQCHELLLRAMTAVASVDSHDSLWWRTDDEYAPITLWVNCNDVFWWATADLEEVTLENVAELEKACADAAALPETHATKEDNRWEFPKIVITHSAPAPRLQKEKSRANSS